jgi:hypothetical protein
MTLSGWQKRWIAISLALVVPVGLWTWSALPEDGAVKQAWANAALLVVKGNDEREWPSAQALRQVLYRGLDDDAVIERVRSDVRRVHERSARKRPLPSMVLEMALVDEYYGRHLAAVRARQRQRIALGGTVWLCLVVLVYAGTALAARRRRGRGP